MNALATLIGVASLAGLLFTLLTVGIVAMVPAAIAQVKGREFLWWWIYSVTMLPVALIHACTLESEVGIEPGIPTSGKVGEKVGRCICIVILAVAGLFWLASQRI